MVRKKLYAFGKCAIFFQTLLIWVAYTYRNGTCWPYQIMIYFHLACPPNKLQHFYERKSISCRGTLWLFIFGDQVSNILRSDPDGDFQIRDCMDGSLLPSSGRSGLSIRDTNSEVEAAFRNKLAAAYWFLFTWKGNFKTAFKASLSDRRKHHKFMFGHKHLQRLLRVSVGKLRDCRGWDPISNGQNKNNLKDVSQGWEDGSVVNIICSSSREPEFSSRWVTSLTHFHFERQ